MRFQRYLFIVSVALLVLPRGPAAVAGDGKREVRALRVKTPPRIDGVLDEAAWQLAEPASDFIQMDPNEGKPGSERTDVRILYDAEALYFGCNFYDSRPSDILSPFTRRDNEIESDWGSIRIDSYHDHQTCFEFTFNPSGVKVDILMFDDGNNEDVSWDPVWFLETRITDEGWTAELKIPFSVLRYTAAEGGANEWGINFIRRISRNQEEQRWVYTPKKESGFVSRFGHLEGLENLPDPRKIEVMPFTVSKQSYSPASPIRPRHDEFTQDLGVDIRYGLSKNFTVDATINPDFGQVEADPAVLNLSTFETFYPEKRPFFIEGTQFIRFTTFGGDFGPGMFYSRRIGRGISENELTVVEKGRVEDVPSTTTLIGAAKISGKTGSGLALGVLEAFTQEERGTVIDSNGVRSEQILEPFAHYNVVRLRQDVMTNSYVGAIFTSVAKTARPPAFTNGWDWKLRLDQNTYALDGFLALSHTTNPADERVTGSAGKLSFSKIAAEHWLWSASMDYTSKKYNINDVGFFFSPNDFGAATSLTYKEDVPAEYIRSYAFSLNTHVRQNFDGVNLFREVSGGASTLLSNYWRLSGNAGYNFGLYDHRETRGNGLYRRPAGFTTNLDLSTDSRESIVISVGQDFEWDEKSKVVSATGLGMELRPLTWIRFQIEAEYARTRRQEAWIMNTDGTAVFGDRSTDSYNFVLRSTLAFTRELTLEYYGQVFLAKGHYENYRFLTGDRDFVPAPATPELLGSDFNQQSLNSNLVLRWEYLPGSTMYLVWSQARLNDDGIYFTSVRQNVDNTFRIPPANVILLKISYWWNI